MSEQLYRVTTGAACFGIVVEAGIVTRAAPIAGKIAGEAWVAVQGRYPRTELIPPVGWFLQEGASGWRAVNPTCLWSTNVFTAAMGGAARAIEAAVELEEKAERTLAERDRLCASLRSCFRAAREGES